jgi:restriction endonuclease S subunit
MKTKIKLKELVDIRVGLPLERKKAKLTSAEQIPYKALTLKSFGDVVAYDELPYEEFIADSKIDSKYITAENNVIVRLRAPNNAIFINNKNAGLVASSLMVIIESLYPNVLDSKFLAYYLNSQYVQNQLLKNSQGTSIIMTKRTDLLELDISLPTLAEQHKIISYIELANQEINLLQKLTTKKTKLKTDIFETLIK